MARKGIWKVMVCCVSAVLLAWLTVVPAASAKNIYPDPSFEATGVTGTARSGERAGYLRLQGKQHWVCIGGSLKVEPFARYRVSAYVRAKIGEGHPFALYCYEWNCYEWAFVTNVPLKTSDQWQRVETTFVSPYDRMTVHPLAFIDCANCEAWVDDLVVEKIAEPEETMAAMMAKAAPSQDELQIIARYLAEKGQLQKARALMEKGTALTRADIACLIAQHVSNPAERKSLVIDVIRYGGPTYNAGVDRFNQITADMSPDERFELCVQALRADPTSTLTARSFRIIAEATVGRSKGPLLVSEAEEHLSALAASLGRILSAMPADSPARTEVTAVSARIEQEREKLAERRKSLGHCTIRIGGKAIEPETHAIVIPDKPTPQEEHAAQDLRYHLELVTGQDIPLVRESELGSRIPIVVGKCALLEKLGLKVDTESLGLEGIFIGTAGPALALVGNKRGVLYACYTFLEDYVGCHWFTPDCSTWPKEGTIKVPTLRRTYIPPLEYRATDYPNSRDADWAVRNRINGTQTHLDEPRGGKISYHHFVHTFNALIPPSEYFDEHPEYFSEIKGKRVRDRTQLCLTNPEVIELAKKRVRQWIEEQPNATIISVSQNDWHNYCQCKNCTALAEKEGSQAGPLIHFVNAIADDIRDDYPHIIIDTLAYQYTRKPPKYVKPRPNVAVRLCSIECCFIHPLATDPYNASFVDDIKGWSKICNRLHIWDYVINYAHSIMPFPNLYVLKPNINFFIDHGVTGIYEEACYFTKGAELAELRTYIMAKTLWDPSYDTDRAIDEFCAAYYGAAGPFVRKYINLIHESAQSKPDMHVRIYSPPSVGYLTPEVLRQSRRLFNKAEAAVRDDPKLLHRVQVARLPLIYSQIALAQSPLYLVQGDRLISEASADIPRLARKFERIARAEGVTRVREGGPLRTLEAWLAAVPRAAKGLKIERLRNRSLELSILPELGGRIWRMRLQPEGRDIIKVYQQDDMFEPSLGGYEEYSTAEYHSPGWNEQYKVADRSEHTIRLEVTLKNGFKLTRSIEIDAEKPLVRLTSTLTNTSKENRSTCLRIHPAFQVETTQKASTRLLRPDGAWRTISLANPKDPSAEKQVWLRGNDIPAGQWEVVDEQAGISIRATFAPEQVGQCLLNWNGKDARVNLELFSPSAELQPGESIQVEHSYEVIRGAH